MISDEEILEIREHLENAQNPIFFYDNDADGFSSYILLRKYINRGKGVAVRSHPDVDEGYAKKAQELNADYIFVLDRPILGEKFASEIQKLQLPIVWIDHHEVSNEKYENVFYYNPNGGKTKSSEPVSYWTYKIANMPENMWISIMGCIADHHLPEFADEFKERYPEYWAEGIKEPFDAYYRTEIGRLARVIGFALKDSITHVVQFQNFILKCSTPSDMGIEIESGKSFAKKYREIRKKHDALVNKAKTNLKGKLLFFNYGGDMSISAEIANELCFLYPDKFIVVGYSSGPITNISARGKGVKKIFEKVLPLLDNAIGGGHDDAVGARLNTKDLEKFKEEFEKLL